MTEQHTSFGGLAVADPRTAAQPVDFDSDPEPDNRRKLALVGAALAVVVVLIAAFFLLKGNGKSDSTFTPVAKGSAGSGAAGTPAAGAAKPIELPKPYHGSIGRDPFK